MANGATGPVWTKEAIICAIQRWAAQYGEPPHSKLWTRAIPGYPNKVTVQYHFGSWNKAIAAAGFRPRSRGVLGHIDPEYTIERFTDAARRRANA